jgi:hypothetical protein
MYTKNGLSKDKKMKLNEPELMIVGTLGITAAILFIIGCVVTLISAIGKYL